MATGYYLLDHPNPHGEHFYRTRKRPVLAIVVHITAGLEDLQGADTSAERTAAYAASTDRSVSWHSGSDSDSFLRLLPDTYTAWHATAYNSSTYGHEISKRDITWADEPDEWVARTLVNAAAALRPVATEYGVPARRATRAELDRAIAEYDRTGVAKPVGFVAHADLDPTRRSDPGADFPWQTFLGLLDDTTTEGEDVDVAAALRTVLNEGTAQGFKTWAATSKGVVTKVNTLVNEVRGGFSSVRQDVAEVKAAVDRVVAGGGAIDYDLLSDKVADKLAERMRS